MVLHLKRNLHNYLFVFEIKSTNQTEGGPSQQVVQLTEVDVLGALLEEPIDKHSIPALATCINIDSS